MLSGSSDNNLLLDNRVKKKPSKPQITLNNFLIHRSQQLHDKNPVGPPVLSLIELYANLIGKSELSKNRLWCWNVSDSFYELADVAYKLSREARVRAERALDNFMFQTLVLIRRCFMLIETKKLKIVVVNFKTCIEWIFLLSEMQVLRDLSPRLSVAKKEIIFILKQAADEQLDLLSVRTLSQDVNELLKNDGLTLEQVYDEHGRMMIDMLKMLIMASHYLEALETIEYVERDRLDELMDYWVNGMVDRVQQVLEDNIPILVYVAVTPYQEILKRPNGPHVAESVWRKPNELINEGGFVEQLMDMYEAIGLFHVVLSKHSKERAETLAQWPVPFTPILPVVISKIEIYALSYARAAGLINSSTEEGNSQFLSSAVCIFNIHTHIYQLDRRICRSGRSKAILWTSLGLLKLMAKVDAVYFSTILERISTFVNNEQDSYCFDLAMLYNSFELCSRSLAAAASKVALTVNLNDLSAWDINQEDEEYLRNELSALNITITRDHLSALETLTLNWIHLQTENKRIQQFAVDFFTCRDMRERNRIVDIFIENIEKSYETLSQTTVGMAGPRLFYTEIYRYLLQEMCGLVQPFSLDNQHAEKASKKLAERGDYESSQEGFFNNLYFNVVKIKCAFSRTEFFSDSFSTNCISDLELELENMLDSLRFASNILVQRLLRMHLKRQSELAARQIEPRSLMNLVSYSEMPKDLIGYLELAALYYESITGHLVINLSSADVYPLRSFHGHRIRITIEAIWSSESHFSALEIKKLEAVMKSDGYIVFEQPLVLVKGKEEKFQSFHGVSATLNFTFHVIAIDKDVRQSASLAKSASQNTLLYMGNSFYVCNRVPNQHANEPLRIPIVVHAIDSNSKEVLFNRSTTNSEVKRALKLFDKLEPMVPIRTMLKDDDELRAIE